MVVLRYVFTLLKALNDLSLVALLAGITRSFITVNICYGQAYLVSVNTQGCQKKMDENQTIAKTEL